VVTVRASFSGSPRSTETRMSLYIVFPPSGGGRLGIARPCAPTAALQENDKRKKKSSRNVEQLAWHAFDARLDRDDLNRLIGIEVHIAQRPRGKAVQVQRLVKNDAAVFHAHRQTDRSSEPFFAAAARFPKTECHCALQHLV